MQQEAIPCLLARQGLVIFGPSGFSRGPTRQAVFYDWAFNYLRDLGIPAV
jgi:hypothetical protein